MGERIIAVIGALCLEAGHHDETHDVLQMVRFGPHRRPERFPSAQSASRSRESRAQILLSLVTAPLTWRKPWRWLAGGRSRFPWREASGCRYGERAREPVLQPDDDQWRRARQRVRHQGLGHPLQDGAAGAPQRAGPFWLAARPAGAAAAQPAAAAIAAGGEWDRGAGRGGAWLVFCRDVLLSSSSPGAWHAAVATAQGHRGVLPQPGRLRAHQVGGLRGGGGPRLGPQLRFAPVNVLSLFSDRRHSQDMQAFWCLAPYLWISTFCVCSHPGRMGPWAASAEGAASSQQRVGLGGL